VLHSRVLTIDTSGSTAAGTVSVPPSRYAGVYYQFTDPSMTATIKVQNLGRDMVSKSGATNSDGVQELAPDAEKLCSGNVVVALSAISGPTAGDKAKVNLFFDFD
jgi:nicotinamide mononucleotide (NMN) deamidase PncC